MTSQNFRKASKLGQAGFTLVEIVMALILLGILTAVAVAKYFDMQEEAARIKCQYGRSVLIEQLHNAFAVSKLENNKNFDDKPATEATINEIMASLDGDGCSNDGMGCPKLCPLHVAGSKDKRYTVSYGINDGSIEFRVSCNVDGHGHTGEVSSATVISDPQKAQALIKFLGGLVDAMASDTTLNGWLKGFFINGSGNMLDSESDQSWAGADYNGYHSMTAPVLVALQKANIQTDNVIWRMIYKPDGKDVNKGTLYMWAASVTDEEKAAALNGGKVYPDLYLYTAKYENGKVTVNNDAEPTYVGKGEVRKFNDEHKYIFIDKRP